jgi:hypothetical protein
MVRVRIDLPLFHSPTEAFGYLSGELDVEALPIEGEAFPWPSSWVEGGPRYLGQESQIWGVSPWEMTEAAYLVTMFGFVCESTTDARACAEFFRLAGGFDLVEY